MPARDLEELLQALSQGDDGVVIGTREGTRIDFKRSPYALNAAEKVDRNRACWELAKDVAALANNAGGALVIGVETKRHSHEAIEEAEQMRPVSKQALDGKQFRDTIAHWTHPAPEVELRWFPDCRPQLVMSGFSHFQMSGFRALGMDDGRFDELEHARNGPTAGSASNRRSAAHPERWGEDSRHQ